MSDYVKVFVTPDCLKKILASIHLCLVFIMGTVLRSIPIKMQHMIFPTADTAISTALCWLMKSILKRSAFLETMRV